MTRESQVIAHDTPGPWRIRHGDPQPWNDANKRYIPILPGSVVSVDYIHATSPDGALLAVVFDPDGDTQTATANARLIAAAPDLLAALDDAAKSFGFALRRLAAYDPAKMVEATDELRQAAKDARAAIAAARAAVRS